MNKLKTLTAAIALSTFGFGVPAVMAQAGTSAPAQQGAALAQQYEPGQSATTPIGDEELKKFAEANANVAKVREEFSRKLNEENNQEKAQELQMEAQEKMMEAVRDADIAAPLYNEIAARIQTDPELQKRVEALQ